MVAVPVQAAAKAAQLEYEYSLKVSSIHGSTFTIHMLTPQRTFDPSDEKQMQ